MKLILVFTIVLVTLSFNICYGIGMIGHPIPIEVNQVEHFKPKIEEHIKKNQVDDDWIYVDKIVSATSQVVAGAIYEIKFVAKKTQCSKKDSTNTKENCKVKDQQDCLISIYEKEWENLLEVTKMNCMGITLNTE